MKQTILLFILTLAFASLHAMTPANPGGSCGANLSWSFDATTGALSITGTGAMTDYSYFGHTPWYVYRFEITSLNLPDGLTNIGNYAFHHFPFLPSVTIPVSVTHIGSYAFSGCYDLPSITIPASVASIGQGAFSDCPTLSSFNVEATNSHYSSPDGVLFNKTQTELIQYPGGKVGNYTIPHSVVTLAEGAFSNCDSLNSVTIGNSVAAIPYRAFFNCDSLESVSIGNSVTTIGNEAFYSCINLTSVTIPSSVTAIGDAAFAQCRSLMSVTLPASVTTIGNSPFSTCTGLTSIDVEAANPNYSSLNGVLFNKMQTDLIQYPGGKAGEYTIPNSVTSIGNYAFIECTGLTSLSIPASLTSFGYGLFWGCSVLTSIHADAANPHYSSLDGVLFDKNQEELIRYPEGRMPSDYTIPASVTSIGGYAFINCTALTSVSIPNSVTTIGVQAFAHCTGLTSVTIPNSVITIGDHAFYYCSNLSEVILGASVEVIYYDAFLYCDGLTSLTSRATVPPRIEPETNLFYEGTDPAIPVYVPCGSLEAYRNASGWSYLTNIQCIPTDVAVVQAENGLQLYPNPAATELRIRPPEIKVGEALQITDILGRVVKVYAVRAIATDGEITVNVSSLPQGVYLLKIGAYTGRFVKN